MTIKIQDSFSQPKNKKKDTRLLINDSSFDQTYLFIFKILTICLCQNCFTKNTRELLGIQHSSFNLGSSFSLFLFFLFFWVNAPWKFCFIVVQLYFMQGPSAPPRIHYIQYYLNITIFMNPNIISSQTMVHRVHLLLISPLNLGSIWIQFIFTETGN